MAGPRICTIKCGICVPPPVDITRQDIEIEVENCFKWFYIDYGIYRAKYIKRICP